jgi:hypothetical protein
MEESLLAAQLDGMLHEQKQLFIQNNARATM